MISTTILRRGAVALLAVTAFGVAPTLGSPAAAQSDCALGAGGEYFPVTPKRVYDSSVGANTSTKVSVTGGDTGIPADDVLAVGANITIDVSRGGGYVAAAPSDYVRSSGELVTSWLNVTGSNETVPNFGLVGVGADGKIKVDTVAVGASGSVRIIVDVFGFVAASCFAGSGSIVPEDGARMIPVTPARIADTRPIAGSPSTNGNKPLSERQNLKVDVRGQGGVPDRASVTAVVVNLTGINDVPGGTTYLSGGPTPVPGSAAEAAFSNGNYTPGQVKANLAIVPLDDNGDFYLFNRRGQINVAIDVVGYLEEKDDDASTGRIIPLEAPFRSFDTRDPEFDNVKLTRAWEDWSFEDFANSVSLDGIDVGAQSALFGNLTVTQFSRTTTSESASTYMTLNPAYQDGAYPSGEAPNSNINVPEGVDVANAAIVSYGSKNGDDYMVSAFNRWGGAHYLLDVSAVILK